MKLVPVRKAASVASEAWSFGPINDGASQPVEEEEDDIVPNTGRWTNEEHDTFIRGLQCYGNQWTRIAKMIREFSAYFSARGPARRSLVS